MTSKRLIFVACFVAAFLAGAALHAAIGRRGHRRERPHLPEELNLTAQQSSKIREIWSAAMEESRTLGVEGIEAIRTEREKGIRELMSSDSLVLYEKILASEAAAQKSLEARRREIFDRAVGETRKILDDKQRGKYDKLMAERRTRREGRDREPMEGRERDREPMESRERPK